MQMYVRTHQLNVRRGLLEVANAYGYYQEALSRDKAHEFQAAEGSAS